MYASRALLLENIIIFIFYWKSGLVLNLVKLTLTNQCVVECAVRFLYPSIDGILNDFICAIYYILVS